MRTRGRGDNGRVFSDLVANMDVGGGDSEKYESNDY